jgi:serine/threonine-protein kinase
MGEVMEAVPVDQFVQLLSKSELLPPEKMKLVEEAAAKAKNSEQLARYLMRQGLLTPWQAGQLLIGRSNFMLGKYRRIDLLGKGGMGTVFLAEHVTMNRRVALKILPKGMENNPAAMERFMAEARAIATLDHPNIVQAYSVDSEADQYYMVMEYVEGHDLERIVTDEGPLDYVRAANYIRQAAEGLAHAHSRGMIHCDIKPSNLLVNTQGVVKILDLGLARLADEEKTDAAAKANEHVLGTVDYMAPEQGLNAKTFDHRADIYSLGCTLYFLLTGQPPFPEGTLAQRIVKHQTQSPPSIVEKRPDAPPQLVRICRKMMAKAPKDRYQSAEDVARALSDLNPERSLKRAVPLDQTAGEEEAPAAREATEVAADPAASSETPEVVPAGTVVASARRTRSRRQSTVSPLIMWGALGLVILLIGTGVAAMILLRDTAGGDRPHVAQPVPKASAEPQVPAASQTGIPTLPPGAKPDAKAATKGSAQSQEKAASGGGFPSLSAEPTPDATPAAAPAAATAKDGAKPKTGDAKTSSQKPKSKKPSAGTKPAATAAGKDAEAKKESADKKDPAVKKEADSK